MNCVEPVQQCALHEVNAAIFDQRPLVEFEINERLENRPRYMLRKIASGGTVDPHDDGRTLIMGQGFQAPVGYRSYDDPYAANCDPVLREGAQEAQSGCGGCATARVGTLVNQTENNACDGVCVVDFAQGYRYRGSNDFVLKLATPERCIETLAKKERRFVRQWIEQESESFGETAFQSYDYFLTNLAIERGGANSVVRGFSQGEPVLTEGGWDIPADPDDPVTGIKHVSIYFLERYREQIVERLRQFGKGGPNGLDAENYVADFELTRDAWRLALVTETLFRNSESGMVQGLGGNIRLSEQTFDRADSLAGRRFDTWNGILRIVFNDEPIRGFLRPSGTTPAGVTTYEFVRVFHLMNVPDEQAGVRAVSNPDYRRNLVRCDGFEYTLYELIPHIHPDSFRRYGLTQGIGPAGVSPGGTNFEVQLLTGQMLSSSECPNWGNKKYRYYAEHKLRWRDIYPELSGFILHRRQILPGYDVDLDRGPLVVDTGIANAVPQDCDNCNEEKCHPECPEADPCTEADNITSMEPCGPVLTGFWGDPHIVTIAVSRGPICKGAAAEVGYDISDGTAEEGTHYEPVDADGNAAPSTGTITWEPEECGTKFIYVRILAAEADTPAPDPGVDNCCLGGDPIKNDVTFLVELTTAVGTTIGDCDQAEITIRNRQ